MVELDELLKQDRLTEEGALKEFQDHEQKDLQEKLQRESEERTILHQQVLTMFKQRHKRQFLRLHNEHRTLEITSKFMFEKLLFLAFEKGADSPPEFQFENYKSLDEICEKEALELRNIQDEFLKVEKLKVEDKAVQVVLKTIQGEGFGVKVDLSVASSLLPAISVVY